MQFTASQRNPLGDRVFFADDCMGLSGPLMGAWTKCSYLNKEDAAAGKPEFPDCIRWSWRHPKFLSPPGSQWERVW